MMAFVAGYGMGDWKKIANGIGGERWKVCPRKSARVAVNTTGRPVTMQGSGGAAGRTTRKCVATLGLAALILAATFTPNLYTPTYGEVLSKPECVLGEGPGCAANASESEFIAKLLEKSRANREETQRKLRDKYWQQGYGDYFSFGYNKKLVQDADGKWSLQEPDDWIYSFVKRLRNSRPETPAKPDK